MFEPIKIYRRARWRVAAEADKYRVLIGGDLLSAKFPSVLFKYILYVDPLKISWRCKIRSKERSSRDMFPDGHWDFNREAMSDYEAYDYRYLSCSQMIEQGLGFRDTKEYAVYLDKLKNGLLARGMSTVRDIDRYMSSLEKFYQDVSLSGQLKTQRQLGESPIYGEINFVIGRDGELLKADDGNHRFAIARVCRLSKVPIQISMIHPHLVHSLLKNDNIDSAVHTLNDYLLDVEARYA